MKRLLFGMALAGVLTATPLVAASKTTDPSSIILNTPPSVASSTTTWEPRLGDYVTFTVSFPKTLSHYGVRIQVLCYQDGTLVYGMADAYDHAFQLGGGSSAWLDNGLPASCHADLYYWSYNGGQKFNLLASTEFDALGR